MTKAASMDEIISEHSAFWECNNKKPILHKIDFSGYNIKPYPIKNGQSLINPTLIKASDIDIDRLLGLNKQLPPPIIGSKLNALGPVYSEAWMEAIIGCPIYASGYSCTAKPVHIDSLERAAPDFTVNNAMKSDWGLVMDEVLKKAVASAHAQIAVRQLHLRGIIDMLSAFLGEEKLCFSVHDDINSIYKLAEKFAEVYVASAQRGFIFRKPWKDGFVSSWGLFAPGKLLDYQIDASNMFSAKTYQSNFLEFDEYILNKFDYSLVHVHACGIHQVESLLKIGALKAIEISLDRETGKTDIPSIIEIAKKIQYARKALLIYGELSQKELHMFISQLDSKGLAVFYWHPN